MQLSFLRHRNSFVKQTQNLVKSYVAGKWIGLLSTIKIKDTKVLNPSIDYRYTRSDTTLIAGINCNFPHLKTVTTTLETLFCKVKLCTNLATVYRVGLCSLSDDSTIKLETSCMKLKR